MRPIDADALKHSINNLCVESKDIRLKSIVDSTLQELFPRIIDDEPTIEAQPVKCGRWYYDNAKDQCFCTECGNYTYIDKFENEIISNYCPDCGAKMEN